MSRKTISKKLRIWMLLFGIFATAAGFGEIILSFPNLIGGSIADAIDVVAWGIFLVLSIPLYVTNWWYAFVFMPSVQGSRV